MAEPFKNLINPELVRQVGHHLARVWPAFDRKAFEHAALKGLEELEFKARAVHLCTALERTLPADFHHAADVLEASIKPVPPALHEHDPDKDLGTLRTDDTGVAGWALWAYGEYIARHGLAHPDRALQAQHAFTQRFTAEFAIRPFIVAHPGRVFATLKRWVHDPSAHVRRLVSEGSRPRLPWGLRLQALVEDPSPTLPLLEALQDDPSEYVRRSVANHLNDIAKDHPETVVAWVNTHLPDAPPARVKLLRHACRTLIKQGHPGALRAWGIGEAFTGEISLKLGARRVAIGASLPIEVTLVATGPATQKLELDYRVHHVKANGDTAPKTFKGKRLEIAPGQRLQWVKQHSLKPVTTRRLHPGPHLLDIHVNGQKVAEAPFELLPAD